jgi:[acyl-carrier-protein] S-malonyltransferase
MKDTSPVVAFLFPGQGSQKVGMGKALAEAFPICADTFDEADAALGVPLSRVCFEGPEDQLAMTENTQPAILAVSVAAYRLLASLGVEPAFLAGHSLGEYSANVAARTFSFPDALRIVRRRGRFMQEAVPPERGDVGDSRSRPRNVAQAREEGAQGDVVSVANMNGARQVVIAGARDADPRRRTGESARRSAWCRSRQRAVPVAR